jgi:hypothetical protein
VLDIHFLAIDRRSESDIGVVVAVSDANISVFGGHVVAGVDGHTGTIHVKSLGGLDTVYVEATSSGCDHAKGKIGVCVVSVEFKGGGAAVLAVDLSTGGNSPSRNISARLTPHVAGKRGDVSGWADSSLDTIVDVDISRFGRSFPVDGGVQTVESIKASITNRNLKKDVRLAN